MLILDIETTGELYPYDWITEIALGREWHQFIAYYIHKSTYA